MRLQLRVLPETGIGGELSRRPHGLRLAAGEHEGLVSRGVHELLLYHGGHGGAGGGSGWEGAGGARGLVELLLSRIRVGAEAGLGLILAVVWFDQLFWVPSDEVRTVDPRFFGDLH